MRGLVGGVIALVIAAVAAGGCTALVDLGKYQTATCTELRIELDSFSGPHHANDVEVRALNDQDNLQCLVRLDPYGTTPNLDIRVPGALDPNSRLLYLWADANNDGVLEAPTTDHSWVIDQSDYVCADQDPTVTNVFAHNFDFVDLTTLPYHQRDLDAFVTVQNVDAPLETFELHVSTLIGGTVRTVGVYRRPKVDPGDPREMETSFDVRIEGVLDTGIDYTVELWNDTNGNQAYDPPPTDEAFQFDISAADLGCPSTDVTCTASAAATVDTSTETPTDIGQIYVNVLP